MWCLGTIIDLNQAAARCIREGRPVREAYKDVGIQMPTPSMDGVIVDSHDDEKEDLEATGEHPVLVVK